MGVIDFIIFGFYMCGVLAIGYYHFKRNKTADDYNVGGRSISSGHVGLSIVATDVGGGFSIGLGGLGFVMGLAGSWLLFTGLAGTKRISPPGIFLSDQRGCPDIYQLDGDHYPHLADRHDTVSENVCLYG